MKGRYTDSSGFRAVLGQAVAKTPMNGGEVDIDALIKNLVGEYHVSGKAVKKIERTEKPTTNR